MKQKYSIIFLAVLSAVFSCVQIDESTLGEEVAVQKVDMTFTATIDAEGTDTKTVLDGKLGDGLRKVLWQSSDAIGVVANSSLYAGFPPVEKFTTTLSENSESAVFEGTISFASEYHAFYPYHSELKDSCGIFVFKMPQVQKYVKGSFDPNSAPMVAVAKPDENFQFRNLCGILALRLSGSESIKSITFIGRDENGNAMPVSGTFEVTPSAEGTPEIRCKSGIPSVTLECASDVSLGSSTSVPFYFVLPPATYSSFLVMIQTTDGKIMLKEGKNPLTIKRSDVQPTAALQYVQTVYIDLSERGNANSYIVPKAGLYTFDADVIGNGEFGIINGANFHTADPAISPASVEVLWEDRSGVITSPTLKDGKVQFMSTGLEGNAVIAVKNNSKKILWSWHIWVTDQPQEHVYENYNGQKFTMLDRNLGATRNDRGAGEQWRESLGLRYQWGRKDPFAQNKYKTIGVQMGLDEVILYPTSYLTNYDQWMSELNKQLWSKNQKTIYDPCPVGYRVPPIEVWSGFTTTGENADRISRINVDGEFDYGWNFIYDKDGNTAWYPTSYYTNIWSNYHESDNRGYVWSTTTYEWAESDAVMLDFYYNIYSDNPDFDCWVNFTNRHGMGNALAVRCMKDEGHVDTSYPTVKITSMSDITSTGARVNATVSDEGISGVIERGVIYGTTEDLTLENSRKVQLGAGSGDFKADLVGLSHSTRYYVKAYATNGRGTSYSKVISFFTPYEGSAVNLSKDGTANCYIVPPVYSEYAFNATVKGNSEETVGTIAEAVVLWETCNTTDPISTGDIIESVSFDGNNVHFFLPSEPKAGNALIAVKDALGTILWSWHIWVVDFDPVKNGQVYISGNMLMDRNLGALTVIPAGNESDYSAYGLFYQWGRKDPFVITDHGVTVPSDAITVVYQNLSSIEETISNPTVAYNDSYWGDNQTLWGEYKTKYDPCPAGWRIASETVWDGIYNHHFQNVGHSYRIIPEPYSVPQSIYPLAGYDTSCSNYFNHYGFWWTSRWNCNYTLHFSDQASIEGYSVYHRMSVRCMKDADFAVRSGAATNVKGTSVDVAGTLTNNDGTVMESVGFIYRDESQSHMTSLRLNGDSVQVVELTGSAADFKTTLTGLKPNTRYDIRAYAKGGYNVRYGDIVSITTTSAGNGEGFDNGGDYEWE